MNEYNEQAVETLDDAGCIIANKNIIIDNLQARIAELEEENARLHEQVDLQIPAIAFKQLTEQLAAAQAYAEQLREALETLNKASNIGCCLVEKALALPHSTSALDAYVSEKAKDVQLQDIEQYRLQMAGISTAAIGYWKEDDSIHPDYDTPALRDVAKLYASYESRTRQRDLAVEALKWLKLIFTDSEMSQERNPELWMPTVEEAIKESEAK